MRRLGDKEIGSVFFPLCWRGLIVLAILFLPTFGRADSLQELGGWLVIDKNLLGKIIPPPSQIAQLSSGSLSDALRDIAREHDLSPKLVQSIIQAESNGNAQAVSPKGAMGLMQLMPETARGYRVFDPFDPIANIRGGVQYLRDLLQEFSGNLSLALAAYNAGPGAVRKYQGIPPYPETHSFVEKIKKGYQQGEEPIQSSVDRRSNEMVLGERIPGKIHITCSPRDLAAFLQKMR